MIAGVIERGTRRRHPVRIARVGQHQPNCRTLAVAVDPLGIVLGIEHLGIEGIIVVMRTKAHWPWTRPTWTPMRAWALITWSSRNLKRALNISIGPFGSVRRIQFCFGMKAEKRSATSV